MTRAKGFNAAAEKTSINVDGITQGDAELFYDLIHFVLLCEDNDHPLLNETEISAKSLSSFIHLAAKRYYGEQEYQRKVEHFEWLINRRYDAWNCEEDQSPK